MYMKIDPETRHPTGLVLQGQPEEPVSAGAIRRDDLEALSKLRTLLGDAAMIAHEMRALRYLFVKALCDDGQGTDLNAASH